MRLNAKFFFLYFCLAIIIASCGKANKPLINQYDYSQGWYHRVAKDETLWSIAKRYGRDVDLLAYLNELKSPDKIYPGDYIYIPPYNITLNEAQVKQSQVKVSQPVPVTAANSTEAAKPKRATRPRKWQQITASLSTSAHSQTQAKVKKPKFLWPVKGRITRKFSLQAKDPHKGLDIAAPGGTRIRAARSGRVIYSGNEIAGYGNLVIIDHGDGYATVYAHNQKNLVRAEQRVKQGQAIALVGSTGHSTGNHLHFEIRRNAKPVDPLNYLPKK